MAKPITMRGLKAGLNNQKLAIAGLLSAAKERKTPVVLPPLIDFVAGAAENNLLKIEDIFSLSSIEFGCALHGVDIIEQYSEPDVLDGWECFSLAANELSRAQRSGKLSKDTPTAAFLGWMQPNADISHAVMQAARWLQQDAVQIGVQMRIERDWAAYVCNTLAARLGKGEDYAITHSDICAKIQRLFGSEFDQIYVTCNEDDLPISKETIASDIFSRYSYKVLWKSDVLPDIKSISSFLGKALLDFEVSLRMSNFVGLTRSTFFNVSAVTNFVRNINAEKFYVYNLSGPDLGLRTDNGAFSDPVEATRPASNSAVS